MVRLVGFDSWQKAGPTAALLTVEEEEGRVTAPTPRVREGSLVVIASMRIPSNKQRRWPPRKLQKKHNAESAT